MPGFPAGTELSAAKGLKGTMAVTWGGRGRPTSASLWASLPSAVLGCGREAPSSHSPWPPAPQGRARQVPRASPGPWLGPPGASSKRSWALGLPPPHLGPGEPACSWSQTAGPCTPAAPSERAPLTTDVWALSLLYRFPHLLFVRF